MKRIPLSQGFSALVDDSDFETLVKYRWSAIKPHTSRTFYAVRRAPRNEGRPATVSMHRQILGLSDRKILTDHKNGDGLDNRRKNLRVATNSQNQANRRKDSRIRWSHFKGVTWDKNKKTWIAQICLHGHRRQLGIFDSEKEAARAYDIAAERGFGEFALLNGVSHE